MYVLAICGSHRNGNTEYILRKILDIFKRDNNKCELILLREKNIELSDGNIDNKHSKEDEMSKIYQKVRNADILILASPAYFNNVSTIMKNFIDRFNRYWEDEALKGKKVLLISVAATKKSAEKCCEYLAEFAQICKMKIIKKLTFEIENVSDLDRKEQISREIENEIRGDLYGKC
ncbi:MAG: NAD(P)H-dependent oxidoreductase [Candidatus Diapherotrites archaeon]|nr:NAD(P)H-dependent oxidoreductase [Candidatus Diapherotrites archaeon]